MSDAERLAPTPTPVWAVAGLVGAWRGWHLALPPAVGLGVVVLSAAALVVVRRRRVAPVVLVALSFAALASAQMGHL